MEYSLKIYLTKDNLFHCQGRRNCYISQASCLVQAIEFHLDVYPYTLLKCFTSSSVLALNSMSHTENRREKSDRKSKELAGQGMPRWSTQQATLGSFLTITTL